MKRNSQWPLHIFANINVALFIRHALYTFEFTKPEGELLAPRRDV